MSQMNRELQILVERLEDERSKRVMFVSHCILNQNTRYLGGAFRKGCIDEIVDDLEARGIGIVQMPCPEQKAWGGVLKRDFLHAFGARNTRLYRFRKPLLRLFVWNTNRRYRSIARSVAKEMRDYQDSGFEVVGIVGVAGSPSCGVSTTLDMEKALEFVANTNVEDLDRRMLNESGLADSLVKGSGFFVRALGAEMKKRGIEVSLHEHDAISEAKGERTKLHMEQI
jgi:predicted secreted protein